MSKDDIYFLLITAKIGFFDTILSLFVVYLYIYSTKSIIDTLYIVIFSVLLGLSNIIYICYKDSDNKNIYQFIKVTLKNVIIK